MMFPFPLFNISLERAELTALLSFESFAECRCGFDCSECVKLSEAFSLSDIYMIETSCSYHSCDCVSVHDFDCFVHFYCFLSIYRTSVRVLRVHYSTHFLQSQYFLTNFRDKLALSMFCTKDLCIFCAFL